jgi:autotransporter adhesin
MNRIYRKVWNASMQQWVVASELACAGRVATPTRSVGRRRTLALLIASAAGFVALPCSAAQAAQAEEATGAAPLWYSIVPGNHPNARMAIPLAEDVTPAPAPTAAAPGVSILAVTGGDHYYSVNDGGTTGGNYNNDGATASGALAAGPSASASGINGVAIGNLANANDSGSIAIGLSSKAGSTTGATQGSAGVAIGSGANALASGKASPVAIGIASNAQGMGSQVAIGDQSTATGLNAVAIGGHAFGGGANAVGDESSAIGAQSVASGDYAMAYGNAAQAGVLRGLALGASAVAGAQQGDVALGAGSATALVVQTKQQQIAGVVYQFAGGAPTSTVSVGRAGAERTITNVAAGRLGSSSTDAVNGSQLYATNQAIERLSSGQSGAFVASSSKTATAPVASGANAAAGGFGASATGAGSTVIGNQATDNGVANATVLGQGASIAAGVSGSNVALGQGSTVTAAAKPVTSGTVGGVVRPFAGGNPVGVVSVGSANATRQITNVAAGQINAGSLDAVNGSQLYATNQQVDANTIAIGNLTNVVTNGAANKYYAVNSTGASSAASGQEAMAAGAGAVASGSRSTALGTGGSAAADGSVALGADATSTGTHSVALGAGSSDDGQANVVSVGSAAQQRRVTHMAAGIEATDGVNVGQLDAATTGSVRYDRHADGSVDYGSVTLGANGTPAQIHNVAAGTSATDAANVGQLQAGVQSAQDWAKNYADQRIGEMGQRFNDIDRRIGHVDNRASAGIAAGIAIASLGQAYQSNLSTFGVGVGGYRGEGGLAVGLSSISETGRYIFKAAISTNTRGYAGVGGSVNVAW